MMVKLPYRIEDFNCILGFKHIIFIFYHQWYRKKGANSITFLQEIWCLDLLTNIWYQGEMLFPIEDEVYPQAIKIEDHDVHFLHRNNYDGSCNWHISIDLHHVLPIKLKRNFKLKYNLLVDGFTKFHNIPSEIIAIIMKFFSSLCD